MPVTQLQDQGGIGTVLGMVGGYLAGNPERKQKQADREQKKAQQDIENKRNAANDARSDAQARDYHDNITSEITTRNAASQRDTTNDANTQFQQGAFGKLSAMLQNRPQGVTAQQWVTHVQQQVPTLGLTDPKLLGQLYGEAQGIVTKDQTEQNAAFAGGEMALPSDPAKKLSVLMKRLQVEKGKPGFDLKPTESMITDTQKQITEAQVAAHQAQMDAERKHHNTAMENRPHAPRAPGVSRNAQGLTPEEVIQNQHWDIEHPKGGKPPKTTTPQARGADYTAAAEAINKGADRDAVIKRFAAKWQLAPDKADALFP